MPVPFPLEYALYRIPVSPARDSRFRGNPELEVTFQYRQDHLETVLNQYQGGMCISGSLTMTERTPRHLISPLSPNWVGTDSACGLAICTFHLGFSLGDLLGQVFQIELVHALDYSLHELARRGIVGVHGYRDHP